MNVHVLTLFCLVGLTIFSGCAPAGHCLRAGPLPPASFGDLSVAEREKIFVARQLLGTMPKLEGPESKASIIKSLPNYFPSNAPACSAEYFSMVERRYLSPKGKTLQADALFLAALDGLGNLREDNGLRKRKAKVLMDLYKRPLNPTRPYRILPNEFTAPYLVLPGKRAIRMSIAHAMSRTYAVYTNYAFRYFLATTINDQKTDPSVRLLLHKHMEVILIGPFRGHIEGPVQRYMPRDVALGWLKEINAGLDVKLDHLDRFKLYLRIVETLGKHGKALRIESQVKEALTAIDAKLDDSTLVKSMAGGYELRVAIARALAQLKLMR